MLLVRIVSSLPFPHEVVDFRSIVLLFEYTLLSFLAYHSLVVTLIFNPCSCVKSSYFNQKMPYWIFIDSFLFLLDLAFDLLRDYSHSQS